MPVSQMKNVVVVGGSYVGWGVAQGLAASLPASHRVVLIEKNSHFSHLFAFPRFSVLTGHANKAFIPFSGIFGELPTRHIVLRALVNEVSNTNTLKLDREVELDGASVNELGYDFLAITTGTRIPSPGTMPHEAKPESVEYLNNHAADVQKAQSIVIVGAGAVGVQLATDIAQVYPEKSVTLVHSRPNLMSRFHPAIHTLILPYLEKRGVKLVLGSRAIIPSDGNFGQAGEPKVVELENGEKVTGDFIILALGQTPNSQLVEKLSPSPIDPKSRFINVLDTLQVPSFPKIFSCGDVANLNAPKAARPGASQAAVVVQNIVNLIANPQSTDLATYKSEGGGAIHLSLGLEDNVIFRNPDPAVPGSEPSTVVRDDGKPDMGIEGVWVRRGVSSKEYSL